MRKLKSLVLGSDTLEHDIQGFKHIKSDEISRTTPFLFMSLLLLFNKNVIVITHRYFYHHQMREY